MSDHPSLSANDFGAAFKGFLDQMATQSASEAPPFLQQLRQHFESDLTQLPIVAQQFEKPDHPNLQLAMDAYLSESAKKVQLLGICLAHEHMSVQLSQLVAPMPSGLMGMPNPVPGPVQYVNLPLDEDRLLTCVQSGLYLIQAGTERFAVLVRGPSEFSFRSSVQVEVMAPERAITEAFLTRLRHLMRQQNVYRGRVVSLVTDTDHSIRVQFHRLPKLERQAIILPQGILNRIERQTLGFSQVSEKLQKAGRHLKRGLLLYGPPGTGKTLTAMYLASQMPERTVILLTGAGMKLTEQSCAMARLLQPSTVILEDVDLIAEARNQQEAGCHHALLFELLNQMDGLADDADVLFLLTTNRPEIIEPALAARPGRVDQAIEIPLPDAECRRRLFEWYGQGLEMRLEEPEKFVERTAGVSAAFIRELIRKAALFAVGDGDVIVVEDSHLEAALYELIVEGGVLTQSLLGAGKGLSS